MIDAPPILRTYRLRGYRARFTLYPDEQRINIEWDPHVPTFTSSKARRRFLDQYRAARADFMQDLAQMAGNILIVDFDQGGRIELENFTQQTTH